jgi:hypothetical protein
MQLSMQRIYSHELKTFWLLFGDKSQAGIKKKTKAEGEK